MSHEAKTVEEPEALFYGAHRVEFTDPEDPRAARLAAGEDIGVDPEAEVVPAAVAPEAEADDEEEE